MIPDALTTAADHASRVLPKRPGVNGTAGPCPSCRELVIAARDADDETTLGVLDPHRLSGVGEVGALLAGRRTWRFIGLRHLRFTLRHAWSIEYRSANECDIVATHECGNPVPMEWRKK